MYFAAVVLSIASVVFYAAGQHEIGSFSTDVCRYGGMFCENPVYVLIGAGLAKRGRLAENKGSVSYSGTQSVPGAEARAATGPFHA